jgi:hypothetical protein
MSALYFVPVRQSRCGTLALCTGRLVDGEHVGIAFSSAAALVATLGPRQPWIHLTMGALREMLVPIGVAEVRIDPLPAVLVAAAA